MSSEGQGVQKPPIYRESAWRRELSPEAVMQVSMLIWFATGVRVGESTFSLCTCVVLNSRSWYLCLVGMSEVGRPGGIRRPKRLGLTSGIEGSAAISRWPDMTPD
nr:hypothetical protein Iba_chr08dCG11300 [Ipomoea batatas]